jgi:NadR type nicotinamide-nucleotide adenylyltransferase
MTTRGLTLGKYAPLHAGHQMVVETALAEVDELIVMIYDCPGTTDVPLNVRAGWIRKLYPDVRVVEAWDGPTEVGDTPEIRRAHEEYVLRRLGTTRITHFYSSEFYGRHMGLALGAVDRQVDPRRLAVPVSGTQIRQDPYGHRAQVHPAVYRDLITNVVLLGAPCTGKSTLAQRLAAERGTVWMPEYGREVWERHQVGRRLTPQQLVHVAEGHLEREEALLARARHHLYTDTNALTTWLYALEYHGAAEPRLAELAAQAERRYDLVLVCDTDVPYDDTWDRSGNAHRLVFQKRLLAELLARKVPYLMLSGGLEARVRRVQQILDRHRKYANPLDCFRAPWPGADAASAPEGAACRSC